MSELLANASCVAINGRGLLIMGAPGSGKSSLALALIDRGAVLIGDDGVRLEVDEGLLIASPPPNISGLLEVRNVGLLAMPTTTAPLVLVAKLSADAPRLPERPGSFTLCGITLPMVALWPDSSVLPLRAEFSLETHGLR